MLLLVQQNQFSLCFYAFYRQKTVCANKRYSKRSNQLLLTPRVIFRTFAQNRIPSVNWLEHVKEERIREIF